MELGKNAPEAVVAHRIKSWRFTVGRWPVGSLHTSERDQRDIQPTYHRNFSRGSGTVSRTIPGF